MKHVGGLIAAGLVGLAACGLELEVAPSPSLDAGDGRPATTRPEAGPGPAPSPPDSGELSPDTGAAGCATGTADCNALADDGCETDVSTDPVHCGECPTICAGGNHGTPTCTAGTCGIVCDTDFADRNGDPVDGCEVDLQNDPDDCGLAGIDCPTLAGSVATCTLGVCGFRCMPGFASCDLNVFNGCEIDTSTDPSHCGDCLMSCSQSGGVTSVCQVGACVVTQCPATHADCSEDYADRCEVNLTDDEQNCGTCGKVCDPAQQCVNRACVARP